jgi:hypothetical protein
MIEPPAQPESHASARERLAARLARENEENVKAYREARTRGPFTTWDRFMRGEVGGPLTRAIYRSMPFLPDARVGSMLIAVLGPVVLAPAVLTVADTSRNWALGWQITFAAACMVAALCGGVAAYALALKSTRDRILGVVGGWGWRDLWWGGMMIIVLPTVGFAVVSALLVFHGLIDVKGVAPTDQHLGVKTFEAFAFGLADSVPILKIPETLGWKPALSFTMLGGALVLIYKLILVVPFVQLATLAISGSFGAKVEEEPDEPADVGGA